MSKTKASGFTRREFLKTTGTLGMLAAATSANSLSPFAAGCTQGQPSGSQELTVNLSGEPETIDPNLSSWAASRSVIMRCFEGLFSFTKDLELTTAVATVIPTTGNGGISSDGLTYTFKLNSKVTWSDGQKVTAGDFEYGIKRMLDPNTAAAYASV